MALRLVNTTPGDVVEPLLPGRPVIFSIKSETGHVSTETLAAMLGSTNCAHKVVAGVALLPQENAPLLTNATTSLRSPEHLLPVIGDLPCAVSGAEMLMGPGPSSGLQNCVYEIGSDVDTYAPLLASVTFKIRSSWGKRAYYWSDRDSLAPPYLGFEYGVRNTGLFAFLRDDGAGGSIVIGGPLQAFSTARPGQVEIAFPWVGLADGSQVSLFFLIDTEMQTVRLWRKLPTDPSPIAFGPVFSLGAIGTFLPASSSFSQRREKATPTVVLYFGNGGDQADYLDIVDYAIYRNYQTAVEGAAPRSGHALVQRPDLPYTFFSVDKVLPTDPANARWQKIGNPSVSFWYQPGRRSVPLYAEISTESGPGLIQRFEPRLAQRLEGFSIEAWMAGAADQLSNIDVGVGLRVRDGQKVYQVSALETDLVKTYGLLKDLTYEGEAGGYWLKTDANGVVVDADYTGLRLVRLTVDRVRGKVLLFVEDPNTPFLEVPITSAFPPSAAAPTVEVGVISDAAYPTTAKIATASYLNRYLAWEESDGLPDVAPVAFSPLSLVGSGSAVMQSGALRLDKPSYGAGVNNHVFYRHLGDFTYLRGFQVDFWARVSLYANRNGISNTPDIWTGAGVTVFLGPSESPNAQCYKVHVGFFDCGAYGRKVAIVPENGYDDILKQTPRGQKYSADMLWMRPFSGVDPVQNLRLVYRPHHAVELWGQGLIKDVPLISIPWDEFEAERDREDQQASITFGNFASDVSCVSEWKYVRWGVSTGQEVELYQSVPNPETILGGRTLLFVDVAEEP